MKAVVMFSGGKDCSLSSIILEPFFDVELVTFAFGILPTESIARKVAAELGFPHRYIVLDDDILDEACRIMIRDRFPNNAINYIHRQAMACLIKEGGFDVLADGLRRDDRVPKIELSERKSIEDKNGISYVSPLMGFGRSAINKMLESHLEIIEEEARVLEKCDYEGGLRAELNRRLGVEEADKLFPPSHKQSRVISRIRRL